MKDLSLALEALWENEGSQGRSKHSADYEFDPSLMEYADRPDVPGYVHFKQYKKKGSRAAIRVPKTMPEYFDDTGKRLYRTDLTVPPKVRQMLFEATGGQDWESFNLASALITLACLGAQTVGKSQWDIEASVPKDPDKAQRRLREAFTIEMRTKRRARMRLK
ncbi:hypothetical protein [Stenotrophomonas maltophilia]|uniref:hypothetical protein n=1 Tax=Stenotrophomonas maltophilia TaxID=40324 RepID=UPI0012FDBCB5|nr:hypothetical protein [Stenotrophomonas maltophilia]